MNSQPVENVSGQRSGSYFGSWLFRIFIWAFWLTGILTVMILFVLPLLVNWLSSSGPLPKSITRYFGLLTEAQTWLMQVLCAVWIFFLGSSFASFLNVVAWRIPRGGTIHGSSHCPDCNQRLRFRDNTPVIGWLRNSGRCSNCQLPIPVRYLLVEILLGGLFLLIAWIQLFSGGWNLPFRPVEKFSGFEHLILEPKPDLISLTVYHLVLICLLFTFTLIKNEMLKIPRRTWLVGLVFGSVMPLIWPTMSLVSWRLGQSELSVFARGSLDQLMTLGLGVAVGVLLGVLFKHVLKTNEPEHLYVFQPTYIGQEVACFSLIGLFLGWQSAVSICLFGAFILLLFRAMRLRWKFLGTAGCMLMATLLHLIFWRISTDCQYWPSGKSDWFSWLSSL